MDKFTNLPTPIKWALGVTGLGVLLGAAGFAGHGSWLLLGIFALVLVVLLLVVIGGLMLWNYWQRRKMGARMRGDLQQSTTAAPRGMTATDLAKLDSMRKKFQEGVDAFRSRGKDLYTLPWYVIIGEPGSGKTEAVRHCNVGFPPGMHEGDNDTGYMGAGGTINMNWWFTNHAVMLDTAGRLVFEEVKPGETSEWKEFLKLLRRNRPNCPVNGLLLVIPSDSLIKDSADEIAAKAGKIAQQLDVIQRILDFRFPVYVVVTKSDKINGFREFFEGMTDPQLQHQMMGWSNPEPLDAPFKPEVVDRHLSQVSERLRRRRLGMMRDPVPESASRRLDEVDSLYALPNSMSLLAPRLRRYLETIFMPGEWSAKPLFLRGIYFTSSMREGVALDQELADAIGVSADELPEGRVWERDRAYFLRDLFMEKIFREKGLVTRATNTRSMLQRRRMILYVASFVALLIFVTVGWLGMRTVRAEVGSRRDYWAGAAAVGWTEEGIWNRPIVKPNDEGGYSLNSTNKFTFDEDAGIRMTLGEFHAKLRDLAANDIQGRWTSPRLAETYNEKSKQAQRVIFETGVLKPLNDAVARTLVSPGSDAAQAGLADALAMMIHLESDIQTRAQGDPVEMDDRAATTFLGAGSKFVAGEDLTDSDPDLVQVMEWTYTSNRFGTKAWPPAWLSRTVSTNGTVTNEMLGAGLENFIRAATNTMQSVGTNWSQVTALQTSLRTFQAGENDWLAAMKTGDLNGIRKSVDALKADSGQVQTLLAAAAKNDLFKSGMSLSGARDAFTNRVMTYVSGAFARIERADAEGLVKHMNSPVFVSIQDRLRSQRNALSASLAGLVSAGDPGEFSRFDAAYLASQADGADAIDHRWKIYERAAALANAVNPGASTIPALGFPVLRASTAPLAPDSINSVAAALQGLSDDLKPDSLQRLGIPTGDFWTNLSARVDDLRKVAKFLQGRDGSPPLCDITLRKVTSGTDPAQQWRLRFRGVALSVAGQPAAPTQIVWDEDQDLGKVAVNQACALQLFQLTDDKAPTATVQDAGPWAPMALIARYGGKPEQDGNFKTWIVDRPIPGTDGGVLNLRLVFDDPAPDPAHWPAE
jgi:hypothetical protein